MVKELCYCHTSGAWSQHAMPFSQNPGLQDLTFTCLLPSPLMPLLKLPAEVIIRISKELSCKALFIEVHPASFPQNSEPSSTSIVDDKDKTHRDHDLASLSAVCRRLRATLSHRLFRTAVYRPHRNASGVLDPLETQRMLTVLPERARHIR